MQLGLRELSGLLQVSESTVLRWIKQRGLPARRVGNQYRFNRAELLEWAVAHQVRLSPGLFDPVEEEAEPVPSLAESLEHGGVHHGLRNGDKAGALRALVSVLPLPAEVDRELLLRLFLARESLASTAVGDGIALPHVRHPNVLPVSRPVVALGFLERPVEFGAMDGQPVHALFALISPTTRSHLQLLSRLSFALRDRGFREAVRRQAPREAILQEARRVEASLVSTAGSPRR
jgi:PTS system nitrogen regulatory IIA component